MLDVRVLWLDGRGEVEGGIVIGMRLLAWAMVSQRHYQEPGAVAERGRKGTSNGGDSPPSVHRSLIYLNRSIWFGNPVCSRLV
jgi:hypothetical protein